MSTASQNFSPQQSFESPGGIDPPMNLKESGSRQHTAGLEPVESENMLKTVHQSVAEERVNNVESQFWATYKKVSNEHDNDFLERANDDMGIILTFAGLFSAVNSTFIVGMQPNPADTTNILMLQLISIIANGPDTININNLSSSTGYSYSTAWIQALSYASLAFSVLAAFGAVLGKQWLNYYKIAPGRGSLEECGMRRQRKLNGAEHWHLQTILGAFLVLLQISLFLFGLSLSAYMWSQQTTISSVIISTTAFGILFYGFTVFVSVSHPDSPFQTPGSLLLGSVIRRFKSTLCPDAFIKSSAIRWILETSTNPEVIAAVAPMVPRVQWPPNADVSAVYTRLLDNFAACLDKPELFVIYGKAMAHLRIQSAKIGSHYWKEYDIWRSWGDRSHFIRGAFMDGRLAWDRFRNAKDERRHKADARTALRTMVVYGMRYHLSLPDDEELIWEGNLQWCHSDGRTPQCGEFDWLVDYLAVRGGDETEGDALLSLSAMHGLGSAMKQLSYIKELIHCMDSTRPFRVRYAALRAVSDAREELSSGHALQGISAELLDGLSCAILNAIQLKAASGPDVFFYPNRDRCYLRLVFALARNDEWRKRLAHHGHVERCISLVNEVLESSHDLNFYLAGIFARIDPSGRDPPFSPADTRWQTLMTNAWDEAAKLCPMEECIDALPTLVMATREKFPPFASRELADLTRYVSWVREKLLQERREDSEGVALSSVQSLYDDLRRVSASN